MHQGKRPRYRFLIGEDQEEKEEDLREGEDEPNPSDKRKRPRLENVEEADPADTIGGLPVEMAHAIMSFAGMKEILSIARTSTTHRRLLFLMMGRGGELDTKKEPSMLLRWVRRSRESYVVDRDRVLSFDENGSMRVNDVILEGNPIDFTHVAVVHPSLVMRLSDARVFRVEDFGAVHHPMRTKVGILNKLLSDAIKGNVISTFPYTQYPTIHGAVFLSPPIDKYAILSMGLDVPKYENDQRQLRRIGASRMAFVTYMVYAYRDRVMMMNAMVGIVPRAFMINPECILIDAVNDGRDADNRWVMLMEARTSMVLWKIAMGDMRLECACEILNGIILFSVVHPVELRRTVFAIERGNEVRKLFHLDVERDRDRVVKHMGYERGVLVMILGPENPADFHDRVVALDMLHGTRKQWNIDATAPSEYVSQASGLQFMLGKEHLQVVLK